MMRSESASGLHPRSQSGFVFAAIPATTAGPRIDDTVNYKDDQQQHDRVAGQDSTAPWEAKLEQTLAARSLRSPVS